MIIPFLALALTKSYALLKAGAVAIAIPETPAPEPVPVIVPPEVEEGSATEAVIVEAAIDLTQQVTELTACVRAAETCIRNLESLTAMQQIELTQIRNDLNALEAEAVTEEQVTEIIPPALPVVENAPPRRERGALGRMFLGASS